jgi:hypothetical protein
MATFQKSGTTEVKYVRDGAEQKEDVPYEAVLASDLEGAMELADKAIPAIGETIKDGDTETKVTAENRQDLMVQWILSRFNQVQEANARQNARAGFLTAVAGPDKQIQKMAKAMAALKNIPLAEAEKRVRELLA